jgi:hypothetical protein
VVQLPKCTRCAQKGLDCEYDLDHLNAPTIQFERIPTLTWNPSNCDSPGYCVMKTLKFRSSFLDPAICLPGHQDTLEIIRFGYLSIPKLISLGQPAMFFHPKLQLHGDYTHLSVFVVPGKESVSYESFKRLSHVDINKLPVMEALTAVQALLIYLATFLFSSDQIQLAKAENALPVLSEWTQNLLATAKSEKPPHLSPWQEWLYGESARRTIIMSYALTLCYNSFKSGYCSDWLFVESLPFDRRPGLWMADSPQAWIAAARAKTGEEVGEHLSSFHTFAENFEGTADFGGDMFLALLANIHNGHAKNIRV